VVPNGTEPAADAATYGVSVLDRARSGGTTPMKLTWARRRCGWDAIAFRWVALTSICAPGGHRLSPGNNEWNGRERPH
jgi:hypothetical protein